MRSAVDRDDTLPALALSHVIQNRHASCRLYDTPEAGEIRQDRGHAALRHASVLRIIDSIEVAGAVTGRNFSAARRRWPILSATAAWLIVFASGRGLQPSKLVLAVGGHLLLDFRCHRRNPSIGRIHN